MIGWALFAAAATGAALYAHWVYLRVDLPVRSARRLALIRTLALAGVLLLLFDPNVPAQGPVAARDRWVLLDASMSMGVPGEDGGETPWGAAVVAADRLAGQGWRVVTFGADGEAGGGRAESPDGVDARLAPALERAGEAGAREVVVLSDFRLEDPAAVRTALESLRSEVSFERFGDEVANAGISLFEVANVPRAEAPASAELEVFGGREGDSVSVEILEEGRLVMTTQVVAPAAGLRSRIDVVLPPSAEQGRVRYVARTALAGDRFPDDDEAVAYTTVGHEQGGIVLISLRPDWEPRWLLPVLADVTGLPSAGYLRVGADRFVRMGAAIERGAPVDSRAVRLAAEDATVLVLHGVDGGIDPWARALAARPGAIVFVRDAEGARLAGIPSGFSRDGEWYVSLDVPASPIAGELAGAALRDLAPLTGLVVPSPGTPLTTPLLLQLGGSGPGQPPLVLQTRPDGRAVVVLASGFYRWAARLDGREAYRRLWSGVAGWVLAGGGATGGTPAPARGVFPRGEEVVWTVPAESEGARLSVRAEEAIVVDTILGAAGLASVGVLQPGAYAYDVRNPDGTIVGEGRFDVAATTTEMAWEARVPRARSPASGMAGSTAEGGRPLRTSPWPYLLIIALLCAEWIGRRRSGLR